MPDRNSALLAAAAVAIVAIQVAAAGGADSPPFAVAIVRRDGMLIPIGAFDGRRWSNAWPPPLAVFKRESAYIALLATGG